MSREMMQKAKETALALLSEELVFPMFRYHLTGRYRVPADQIVFNLQDARRRIREATYLPLQESKERFAELRGETDGDMIWVTRGLDFEDTVDTLLHEAMHDSVFIRRATRSGDMKGLSCELEHQIMDDILPVELNV